MTAIAVAVGGAVGACLRAALMSGIAATIGHRFAHALAVVNLLGSFLFGWIIANVDPLLHPLLLSGFCGGLTTFSTFAHSAVELLRAGRIGDWVRMTALHLAGSIVAVACGAGLAAH